MQTPRIRVLLVEDEAAAAELVKAALTPGINAPVELCYVERLADAFEFSVPFHEAFEAGAKYLLARGYR